MITNVGENILGFGLLWQCLCVFSARSQPSMALIDT